MFDILYTSVGEETPTEETPTEGEGTTEHEGGTDDDEGGRSSSPTGSTHYHSYSPVTHTIIYDNNGTGQQPPHYASVADGWVTLILVLLAIIVSFLSARTKKDRDDS